MTFEYEIVYYKGFQYILLGCDNKFVELFDDNLCCNIWINRTLVYFTNERIKITL